MRSLVTFPDLIEPMTRVGREIRLLDQFYLEGSGYEYRRVDRAGRPDWDLATVASLDAALLFALDLAYRPDPEEKVLRFGEPREVSFAFRLPAYLLKPAEVFRNDAYLRPFHVESSLDYVASGTYRREPSFQRYIQERAERARAAGGTSVLILSLGMREGVPPMKLL